MKAIIRNTGEIVDFKDNLEDLALALNEEPDNQKRRSLALINAAVISCKSNIASEGTGKGCFSMISITYIDDNPYQLLNRRM
ncbi:MAG: hypothetical protein WCS73_12555 [Lentisphaeria bacterium]